MSADVFRRFNVQVRGKGPDTLVFAHGFGCDQRMWRFVAPRFETTHRVVLFDLVGSGGSDLGAYDPQRHASLQGYAPAVAVEFGRKVLYSTERPSFIELEKHVKQKR